MNKIDNYCNAISQLDKAIIEYQTKSDDTLYRDGLIQRFEFSTELAWKSIKEYLEDQGFSIAVASPRAILKEAFAGGIIDDEDAWNDILNARNLTSHIYDEKTATDVAARICGSFMPVFKKLETFYKEKNK